MAWSTRHRVAVVFSMCCFLLTAFVLYYQVFGQEYHVLPLLVSETKGPNISKNERLSVLASVSNPNGSKGSQKVSELVRQYLFFIQLDEQLSQTTVKYLQLCYFSALWNLNIIEPSIYSETQWLSSLPQIGSKNMLPYFYLYNITAVEQGLTKCLKPNLPKEKQKEFKFHKLDEALIYSPREILILRFMQKRWAKKKSWNCGVCDHISNEVKKTALLALNTHVHEVGKKAKEIHGEDYSFKVWRTLCIDALTMVPFSFKDATNCILKHLHEKQNEGSPGVSVVIEAWEKVVTTKVRPYYYCPDFTFDDSYCQNNSLPHTPIVLSTADEMKKHFNLMERFIGVYARTELLARKEGKKPGTLEKCFSELLTAINTSQALYNISLSNVVLVHDAGKYGSESFGYGYSKGAMPKAKKLLEMFKTHKIRTVYYDPEVRMDLPQHRAFIAAVEQEFLSRSHVLMTIGGGGFMRNVKGRFLKHHGEERLHVICEVLYN